MSEVKSSPVFLDEILIKFSLFGRYYAVLILMIFLINISDTILVSDYVFITEKVSYWCADKRFGNDSCASLSNSTEVCTEWVYENPHSFVAEFGLACQEWKRTMVGTVQSFGYGLGLLIIGPLSDRWGRKMLTVMTCVILATTGIARSFATNYWIYIVLEFVGSALGNCSSAPYILMIEMVAHEKRVLTKVWCSLGLSFAYFVLASAAWLFPYWRQTLLAVYAPAFIYISFIFLLDETPRWLLSKGRKDDAINVLKKAAKYSKIEIDKDIFEQLVGEENNQITLKQSLKETLASRLLLKRLFMCFVWWTVSSFVYVGIRVNSVLLPGNKYINFVIVGFASVPARIFMYWLLSKFSRKTTLISALFLCALVLFIQPFLPESIYWLSFLIGKFFVTIVFSVTYIFTSELFPTYSRNSMHALCSSFGRVGSVLAPQTPLLMIYWDGLPSLTFGIAALVAGCVTLLAPKTANDVLPDNVRQAEAIGQKKPQTTDEKNNIFVIHKHGE